MFKSQQKTHIFLPAFRNHWRVLSEIKSTEKKLSGNFSPFVAVDFLSGCLCLYCCCIPRTSGQDAPHICSQTLTPVLQLNPTHLSQHGSIPGGGGGNHLKNMITTQGFLRNVQYCHQGAKWLTLHAEIPYIYSIKDNQCCTTHKKAPYPFVFSAFCHFLLPQEFYTSTGGKFKCKSDMARQEAGAKRCFCQSMSS